MISPTATKSIAAAFEKGKARARADAKVSSLPSIDDASLEVATDALGRVFTAAAMLDGESVVDARSQRDMRAAVNLSRLAHRLNAGWADFVSEVERVLLPLMKDAPEDSAGYASALRRAVQATQHAVEVAPIREAASASGNGGTLHSLTSLATQLRLHVARLVK